MSSPIHECIKARSAETAQLQPTSANTAVQPAPSSTTPSWAGRSPAAAPMAKIFADANLANH